MMLQMNKFLLLLFISCCAIAQDELRLLEKLGPNFITDTIQTVITVPTATTKSSVTFQFPESSLEPGKAIFFKIPQHISKLPVLQISFGHRQKGAAEASDLIPGLTPILAFATNRDSAKLRFWAGPSSGLWGAKFAENRTFPEHDNLYEWPRIGHKGLAKRETEYGPVLTDSVLIYNVGKDVTYISELRVDVIAPPADMYFNYYFSPNSSFGNRDTLQGRKYGGQFGNYPGAIRLSSPGKFSKIHQSVIHEGNRLIVSPQIGSQLGSIEIMCGDGLPNGSPGNGELIVYVKNLITSEKRSLIQKLAIPPQGVVTLSDVIENVSFSPED